MENDTSNKLWEIVADDWDVRIGSDGNAFHRELVRPATLRMLSPKSGERILDIACGNGMFALYLAKLDVKVVAFDYSRKMIEYAKKRCADYLENITLSVADATDYSQVMLLGCGKPFDKAVANMAVMDISDITPLFKAVSELLKPSGIFVFSAVHPCFQTPGDAVTADGKGLITINYIKPQRHSVQILADNPKIVEHWHRPLQVLLNECFNAGFVLDGLEEPTWTQKGDARHIIRENIPPSIVMRVRKG